ncbi:MAG: disulfide bond formation protein B [Betaproteobacteria bacterium]|nr:disulfide bond formation protein B [Betaproteobacteria bacterium]
MPFRLSLRSILALIGLICFALLAFAWFLQYGPDKQQPCPLCILQRYVFMALGTVCLLAAAHWPGRNGQLAYLGVADLLATTGIGMATWQLLKGGSMTSCLADPIGDFVNGLPSANWWPEFLFATGGCADKYPPVLGISVPVWALIWFAALSLCFGWMAASSFRSNQQ